jgi:hypothetical protein
MTDRGITTVASPHGFDDTMRRIHASLAAKR